jgi:uncharacterized protein
VNLPQPLSGARNISLETYRKSGAPVRTTVWLVQEGGSLYVRTDPRSGKVNRLRSNPRVRLAPSDIRGNIKGDWAQGEARFVEDSRALEILRLFRKKYGLAVPLIALSRRLRGFPPLVVIEISVERESQSAG